MGLSIVVDENLAAGCSPPTLTMDLLFLFIRHGKGRTSCYRLDSLRHPTPVS